MTRVLLIEDERVIRQQLKRLLERNDYDVVDVENMDEAERLQPESFDVILADIRLPGRDGTHIFQYSEQVPVIMMTSYASVRSAIESMKFGATDYISKPFDHDELLKTIARSLQENRMSTQNAAMRKDLHRHYLQEEVISSHPQMQKTVDDLKKLESKSLFVYLQGERGTSKEVLARICHDNSDRREGPLVFVDLPIDKSTDLEGVLFGPHSDQQRHHSGPWQAAHCGTLVIRGVDELAFDTQRLLVELLTEAKNRRSSPNLRLIALAIEPLQQAVESRLIHPILADHFNCSVFATVPLRSRREDIEPISTRILEQFARRYRKRRISFSTEAVCALQAYQWPGNVNELKGVIERAVLTVDSGEIKPIHLGISAIDGNNMPDGIGLSLDSYFRNFVLNYEDRLSETELASQLGISRKALWERRQKMELLRRV